MVTIRNERVDGYRRARGAARSRLRRRRASPRPSERLREGRLPADGLSFVAVEGGRLVGTVRLWHVTAGPGRPALLLGPLAVASGLRATAASARR